MDKNFRRKMTCGAAALMCALSLSIPAFAQDLTPSQQSGTTKVALDLDEYYEITIPADVTLSQDESWKHSENLSAAKVRLDDGNELNVKLTNGSAGEFKLKNGANELTYAVKKGTAPVTNGQEVLTVASGTDTGSAALEFSVEESAVNAATVSGKYSDTITFTASIDAAEGV